MVWKKFTGLHRVLTPTQLNTFGIIRARLQARPSHPIPVSDLTNALVEEWSKILMSTLLNLVENLPRSLEAVIAAKGGNIILSLVD